MKKKIDTANAPSAIGPYSQAIDVGNMVFVSGQLPLIAETGRFPSDDVAAQTERSLENIKGILEACECDMEHIVKTTVYLADMNDFAAMNKVYGRYFEDPYPARVTVEVAELPQGAKVEIDAIALK